MNEAVRLINCSDELRNILRAAFPYSHGESLRGAIGEFAKMVSQEMLLGRQTAWEIRAGWDRSTSPPKLERAAIVWIPFNSLISIGPLLLQVIPRDIEGARDGRFRRLDRKRIAFFRPPERWRTIISRVSHGLPLIGALEHDWMMDIAHQQTREDFKSIHRAFVENRAKLTAPIGWTGRGQFQEFITDFHWAVRSLRWQRFCIEIRDSILGVLGEVFSTIGLLRNESPQLVWDKLPSLREVEWGENRLQDGAPFEEVLKPFRLSLAG